MIVTTCMLAALLAQAAATPVSAADCDLVDNLCNARRFERDAKSAPTPDLKATYLYAAHRSYLFSFDKSRKPDELCAARRAFDASLAVKGQSNAMRSSTEATRGDLVARERTLEAPCAEKPQPVRKRRREQAQDPPLLAAADVSTKAAPDAHDAGPEPTAPQHASDSSPPLMAARPADATVHVEQASPAPATKPRPLVVRRPNLPPEGPTSLPRGDTPPRRETRPGRPLVIAGGLTLGAGLTLAGVAGYMGGRTLDVRRERNVLGDMVDGYADDHQLARDDVLTRDYERMGTQTLALALAGGTTIVVAAVLLGVGGRRMARVTSRTSLAPVPGGLVFRAQF